MSRSCYGSPKATSTSFVLLPQHLKSREDEEHEKRQGQVNEESLNSMVDRSCQEAIQGQDPAGHSGEGQAGCTEDDLHTFWGRDVDAPQQGHVLQPQVEGLHQASV